MKKALFFMLVFSLGVFVQAKGEDTDISLLDNVIYIDPMTAESGSRVELSVMMKNSIAAQSFGFKLSVPVGMHAVTNEKGKPVVNVNSNRVSTENLFNGTDFLTESIIWVNIVSDGQIAGNKGEIATIPIDIDSNIELTDYPLTLTDIRITPLNQSTTDPIILSQVTTTLTLTGIADTRTTFDENSDNADVLKSATGVDVRVKRTIKANEWSTLCLPFAMMAAQVEAAFGDAVELGDFTGCDVDDTTGDIQVKFSNVTAIEANHPYIIKVSEPVTEFTVDGVDIAPEDEPSINKDKSGRRYNSFIGTYVAETVVPDYCLFLSDNQFWFSTGKTKMKAFRAYFDLDAAGAEYEDAEVAARITMAFDEGETTGIENLTPALSKGEGVYYNLKGQQVAAPSKGLYIKDGKKMVVK